MPRAVRHSRYGAPDEVLELLDLPAETPADDEVVIRMEAAAMHIADLRTIQGVGGFDFPLPRTPGFEGVGRVIRKGAAVREYDVGSRVFAALGAGTFREEVRCRAAACIPAPPGDAIQLALLIVNGATAAVLLEDFCDFGPGDWLIQNAANSSCGRFLIRLARRRGVRTVNVVRRPEMIEELRELGGDVVLLDGPDLAARVRQATDGGRVRLGIDAVAGPATQRIAECLEPESNLISYGSMTNQRCEIDFYLLFRQGLVLQGLSFARQFQKRRTPQQVRDLYLGLAQLMSEGVLVAKIAGVYDLADIKAACARAALTGSDRDGKVIVTMA